jgi:type III secretory pathway component EscV
LVKASYLIAAAFIIFALASGYDWLLFAAFAFLVVVILLSARKTTSALPPGLAQPRQVQAPRYAAGYPPSLPKKKKKIRRPIIIVQQPSHTESMTKGVLDEAIKKSFPRFMTPQEKTRFEKEEGERGELIKLLREQRDETKKLRKKMDEMNKELPSHLYDYPDDPD